MNEDVNIKKNDENIDGKNKESEKLMKDGHLIKEESEFDDPDELFKELINKIYQYHPSTDISLIQKAYDTAFEAHKDQKRKSGEPYIIHPVEVAIILAELEMDKETIAAGLLHDVVEDTAMSYEDVVREFGEEVALLVDGVTKLTQLNYAHDKVDTQAENLRKMFLAMAKDIRVVIIKLIDRLHNMRTLEYMSAAKQREKSREVLEIYSPLAHRLGMSKIKAELEDLALKYIDPYSYEEIRDSINQKKAEREKYINDIICVIEEKLKCFLPPSARDALGGDAGGGE